MLNVPEPLLATPRRRRAPAGVVVGASAGGLEAIAILLEALPANFAPPLAIVLHLPPGRPSLLTEVLAPRCALPVREPRDKEPMRAGCVYVAPPDYHLLIEPDGGLSLSADPPVHFSRPSIDVLFQSAAWAWRERALGIVLSGANEDGAEGLRTIRDAGGQGWVQDPADAGVPAMPRAAIARAEPGLVAPVARLGAALAALAPLGRAKRDEEE